MVLDRLLSIFSRETPDKKLAESYSALNKLTHELRKDVLVLLELKEILRSDVASKRSDREMTGDLSYEKSKYLKKIIKKIEYLEMETEKRFIQASDSLKDIPIVSVENYNVEAALDLLNKLKNATSIQDKIDKTNSKKEKLELIESAARSAVKIYEDFLEKEKETEKKAKKFVGFKEGSTLKRAYEAATPKNNFCFHTTRRELSRIADEAKMLNDIGDPDFEVKWRGMLFNKIPPIEQGHIISTVKQRHANIMIKLNGKKKNIHCLLN